MKYKSVVCGIASTVLVLASGCVTAPPAQKEPLKAASFDYTPPSTSAAGSAGMKIILVDPSYAEDFAYSGQEPYESFGNSMADDFEEVLASLGYVVYGPYRTYDEIVFAEKEVADLILLTDIELAQSGSLNRTQKMTFAALLNSSTAEPSYTVNGTVSLTGKITLKAREPQSGEQMWVKSVEIQPKSFGVASQEAWPASAIASGGYYSDPGVFNPTVDALQDVYQDALGKSFIYLDPRELQTLRPQIERIKKRIRF